MDEVNNARIQPQNSICSDSNGEETSRADSVRSVNNTRRLCIVGKNIVNDSSLLSVAESFGVPVVTSENGQEYAQDDNSCSTIFVLESFEGDVFSYLCKKKHNLIGPTALRQLADKNEVLPHNTRPLFNLAMFGVVVCFTGFRNKDDLTKLVPLIHHMGGSIRKDMSVKVTHLIANTCGGEKYHYAATFRVPVMNLQWVYTSWERRNDVNFYAKLDTFVSDYKLKPFHGAKVCFVGFPEEEESHMTEILVANGGAVTNLEDPTCTHVVTEHAQLYSLEAAASAPPLSPTPLSPSFFKQNKTFPAPDTNFNAARLTTPLNKTTRTLAFLETLHEKSQNDDDCNSDLDSVCFDRSLDLNVTSSTMIQQQRKRKLISPDTSVTQTKRLKDKSYSEKKRKVSQFFKTPINYFSQRRRTIDSISFNQTLNNSSVLSSSGVFNVDTVEHLNRSSTPLNTQKPKNIFTRTFSSSKFSRSKLKKFKNCNLNATKLSFGGDTTTETDSNNPEKLNVSCFPDILSVNPCASDSELQTANKEHRRLTSETHTVVVDSGVVERPDVTKPWVVKAEWFWTSVQKEISLEEKEYLLDDTVDQVLTPHTRRDSHQATPSSASRRKRKRIHETLSHLVQHQQSPGLHKRRSSVSDAGLLSVSGSFLDCTASPDKAILDSAEPTVETPRKGLTPRHQAFLELVQTESNYVEILHTLMTMFKKHLEDMPEEEALLNNTELNLIFGKLPPIYETHIKMLDELKWTSANWSEDRSVGNVIIKYSTELQRAYPPFINYFEEMKEMLIQCDQNKPRFHAFLKACQTKPECGRQSLQDLMIRPVQRLGSITLLLTDILKNTVKSSLDYSAVDQALAALREVMTHINEDKRKAEGQITLFNIFNDIDNCPPDIVSSHRHFIAKSEVIQLPSPELLSSKGNNLVLFLFSDRLEVCKKKSKYINSLKSPTGSVSSKPLTKPLKHVRLLALNTIKKVIDIKETEDCQKVFCLVCKNNDEIKERLYSFAMADETCDKSAFLRTLTRQMANNSCTPDAEKFLASLEPQDLDIDTSELANGTLSKAIKFATRTRLKVERAFSFNKTPSKLKRAVSSMMSPFGSSTNLTPASQLANMRLASYNNISELGNAENAPDSPPPITAPMSVQPTRKMKASSLGVNALKRL